MIKHKEGDIWTEKGKTWTIKNGIKKTYTKMSETRKKIVTPLSCPKCTKSLSHWLDKKMYDFNGFCHDCTIEYEHNLIKQGKFADYEKNRVLANAKSFMADLESYVEDYIKDNINNSQVTEDGDVESWVGNADKRLEEITKQHVQQAKQDLNNVKNEQ